SFARPAPCSSSRGSPSSDSYPLSLHDALPIFARIVSNKSERLQMIEVWWNGNVGSIKPMAVSVLSELFPGEVFVGVHFSARSDRSEEHTSELQSRENLVCRLLLAKTKESMTSG